MPREIKYYLNRAATGEPFSRTEMREAMALLLAGDASDIEIAGMLMALRVRGPTVDELAAGVEAMRDVAIGVNVPEGALDTCGTGGDGADTFNISTAVAFVVAGAGIPVAKHGSTASSSRSGSAEVLRELGVKIDASPKVISRCVNEAGVGFMFAAKHHAAVRNVMAARKGLGVRTLFNVLGPLSNPARARRQLMGVYDRSILITAAKTMDKLGVEKAWVVHGADGLDELSTTGESFVAELNNGRISEFSVTPESAELARAKVEDLRGGDPVENARAIHILLDGERGPFRDITILNAAGALIVADKADTLTEAATMAASSIDSGKAKAALASLVEISNTTS